MTRTALATPEDDPDEGRAKKARKPKRRANGEGSIFPYRNGYAAYVWVTNPAGERKKKWVYGKSREEVHDKWVRLHADAQKGPVVTKSQTLGEYLTYWLSTVVIEPDYAPLTISTYETHVRLHIRPGLGGKRMDKLTMRHVRTWLRSLRGLPVLLAGQGCAASREQAALLRCGCLLRADTL